MRILKFSYLTVTPNFKIKIWIEAYKIALPLHLIIGQFILAYITKLIILDKC